MYPSRGQEVLLKISKACCYQVRLLAEKVSDQPESHDDKEKKVEFSVPTWQVTDLIYLLPGRNRFSLLITWQEQI
jgi:hypothetical protein